MAQEKLSLDAERKRLQIGRRLRELRTQRGWSQLELAQRLDISQGHLSQVERGSGSLTAEQFLKVLALFNVPSTHFAPPNQRADLDLQNALARLGAHHLRESTDVLPSEQLDEVANVAREALLTGSARAVSALAPVFVSNVERLNVSGLLAKVGEVGLQRRLGWALDNTVAAVREALRTMEPGPWMQQCILAEFRLGLIRDALADQLIPRTGELTALDPLDADIATPKTYEEVKATSSPISKRWGILTGLQVADFADALKAARAERS
jgi:transcriptional regulator with XRE-family HTH domain